ncbi:GIP [Symbiodinium necroappetens]|uniref:GIP protein n=1 Tax=Symbiodinium necroappetens TaxID=1628268 RepID=A0A812RD32_9DINO|nr:GIP [Symbiodinium necroappetens]
MHEKPVRHVLVATLTVPVYTDGRPKLLVDPNGDAQDHKLPEDDEGDHGHGEAALLKAPSSSAADAHDARCASPGSAADAHDARLRGFPVGGTPNRDLEHELDPDLFADEKAFKADGVDEFEDTEGGEDPVGAGEHDSAEPEGEKGPSDKFCKDMRAKLTEPVRVHSILFAEPLTSKRGSVVLQAVQRIYARIRLLNLSVRRIHSDQGREFTNRNFVAWATSRDIALTHSSPSDPKANGRVEAHINLVKGGVRTVLSTAPDLPVSCWPHALRQWVAQRFERSMSLLGGQLRSRPLVPYGTRVVVRKREWSRKSPFDVKTLHGTAVCPSERVHNATVVRLVDTQDDGTELVRLYTAPVAVQRVLQPVQFEGRELPEEADDPPPPLPPPSHPPRTGGRRLRAKSAPVARSDDGVEGLVEDAAGRDAARGESDLLFDEPVPGAGSDEGGLGLGEAFARGLCACRDKEKEERSESESLSESEGLLDVEARAQQLLKGTWIPKGELNTLLTEALQGKVLSSKGRKVDRCSRAQGARGLTLGLFVYGNAVGITKQTTQHKYLTAAVNKYLQQIVPDATWAALRVLETKGGENDEGGVLDTHGKEPANELGELPLTGEVWQDVDSWRVPLTEEVNALKAIIVTPPRILVTLNIVEPGEKWLVLKALYGLAEAPAAWATERDLQLSHMKWTDEHGSTFCLQQCHTDENLWKILRWDSEGKRHMEGLIGIYVDDILFTGETEAVDGFVKAVQGIWTTSEPELVQPGASVRFCGFNLHALESGGFLLNQEDYIRDLLLRYPHVVGTSEVPYLKDEEPSEESPNLQTLRQAQAYGGAFQWLSCRSRPDIAYATNRIAHLMSKFPAYAVACSETLLKYLRRTIDLGLRFDPVDGEAMFGESDQLGAPRQLALLEIFADASFAPANQKSQTGVVATFGGAAVVWLSTRQSVVSLSTAESELHSTIDGITLLHVLGPIIAELLEVPVRKLVYNDNVSCVTLFSAPSGAWRTRHLRLKAKAFREQLEDEQYELRHLVGRWMLGDLCTKPLQGQRLRELCQLLGMTSVAAVYCDDVLDTGVRTEREADTGARTEPVEQVRWSLYRIQEPVIPQAGHSLL